MTNFPKSVRYDGGLTCGLYQNKTDPVLEPFPPGTRVSLGVGPDISRGTVRNIPIPTTPIINTAVVDPHENSYTIAMDDGTTRDVAFEAGL